jgi:hypothetical protein
LISGIKKVIYLSLLLPQLSKEYGYSSHMPFSISGWRSSLGMIVMHDEHTDLYNSRQIRKPALEFIGA